MLDEIKPNTRLAKKLKNLGIWLQNNSSSKTGNVRRTFKSGKDKIVVTVRPSGIVGISGYISTTTSHIELAYGKLTIYRVRRDDQINSLPRNQAAYYLKSVLDRMIPFIPSVITRNQNIRVWD